MHNPWIIARQYYLNLFSEPTKPSLEVRIAAQVEALKSEAHNFDSRLYALEAKSMELDAYYTKTILRSVKTHYDTKFDDLRYELSALHEGNTNHVNAVTKALTDAHNNHQLTITSLQTQIDSCLRAINTTDRRITSILASLRSLHDGAPE